MMQFPWIEFLTLMVAFGIGAVSPGPDFAMVLRQSIAHGRGAAILTSLGIASAILVHGAYTLLGIGLIVSQSIFLFTALKFAGAAYLLWLGIGALRASAPTEPKNLTTLAHSVSGAVGMSNVRAFSIGFLTNLLNPKAVLFFLSLFTTLVSADTQISIQAIYVLAMSALLAVWFVSVSTLFTTARVRQGFYAMGRWFNRVTGMALILLAMRVAVSQQD